MISDFRGNWGSEITSKHRKLEGQKWRLGEMGVEGSRMTQENPLLMFPYNKTAPQCPIELGSCYTVRQNCFYLSL